MLLVCRYINKFIQIVSRSFLNVHNRGTIDGKAGTWLYGCCVVKGRRETMGELGNMVLICKGS